MKTNFFFLSIIISMAVSAQSTFTGKFAGEQNGIASAVDLKNTGGKVTGSILINGKKGTVNGKIADTVCKGTVYDIETGTVYSFKSFFAGSDLHFVVTFPEFNNLDVDMVMQKQTSSIVSSINNNKTKDTRLVGVWRYTDIITSGSGGNFGSFSTDYFMELKADGTALSWTGSSAGGAGNVSISGTGGNHVDKGQWFTEGKNLILFDATTNQKVTTMFSVDATRMMLHNGGSNKRIWVRIS
jgi:hypothetical protein